MIISFDQYKDVLEHSMMSFLSPESRELIFKVADIVTVDVGGQVPRGPAPADLFILLDGEFTFTSPQGVDLGRSKNGRSFEFGTLMNQGKEWTQRWRCERRSAVMKIPWPIFLAELKKDPQVFTYLNRITHSVQLQKLKRDMQSLNVTREAIIELMASFSEENFELIFSDWNRKAFVTIITGEIAVSILVHNQKNNIATFQIGDSCYLDLENSDYVYEASPGGRAFVIYEEQWNRLKNRDIFESFLRVYRPHKETRTERTVVESTKTFALKGGLLGTKKVHSGGHSGNILPGLPEAGSSKLRAFGVRTKKYQSSVVIQTDEMRSGAAVLATVARCAGFPMDSSDFEDKFPVHSGAKSLEALKSAAEEMGFVSQLLEIQSIQSLYTNSPVIIPFAEKFMTIFEGNDHFVSVGDPENGQAYRLATTELARRLVGRKYLKVEPTGGLEIRFNKQVSYFDYLLMLRFMWWPIGLYFLAGIMSFFCSLSAPFLNQYIFDTVIVNLRKDLLNQVTLLTILIMMVGALFDVFNQTTLARLKQGLSIRVVSLLHAQIFKLPVAYFKRGGFSAIIGRLSEVDGVTGFVANNTLSVCLSLILSVFSFAIMWIYNPIFVAVVFVMVPIQSIVIKMLAKNVIDRKFEASILKSRENGLIYQHFRSPDNTRVVNGLLTQRWQYEKNTFSANELSSTQFGYDVTFSLVNFLCGEMVRIIIIIMAGYMYVQGTMSVGKIMAVSMIIPKINSPIQQIFQSLYSFLSVKASMRRLDHFFLYPKELKSLDYPEQSAKIRGQIRFDQVSFKYERTSKHTVVDNISFEIKQGEFIVVVGPTGSGKTTLAGLLGQLMQPTSGKIYIDGQLADKFALPHLRKEIGYVEQEGSLFSGTIQQNIAMWQENPLHEKVANAARIADIEDFILSAKEGYASEVGSLGAGVSEGQKQRLLISRAIFTQPSMLILDESTSNLDTISEERVVSRLLEEFKGRTVVFFTQRIHLASRADRIFYMDNGKLAEVGTHKELIARNGKYFNFFCNHLSLG